MHYFSTNKKADGANFREAVLNGQPDDVGLYFPERIPKFTQEFLMSFADMENHEIALKIMLPYVGNTICEDDLGQICRETFSFDFPLVRISERMFALELFHGPTLAFKDVGARFMSRCLRKFSENEGRKTLVVVATSGDTGGAVAAGFHGVENIEVVILYPKDKVSRVQELQLTTLGGNVTPLKVSGDFDDCQSLAKQALADVDLKKDAQITSANSINVARWLPQQIYYMTALKRWSGDPPVFSVPSGNFGNICAGMLAALSGLPVDHFIAACNANATVPRFLETGELNPAAAVPTLSNAMDVASPSNFVRILEMFNSDMNLLRETMSAVSVTDLETETVMKDVFETTGYILDPHAAVAYKALHDHLDRDSQAAGIFLETAHPVKFDSVKKILGTDIETPEQVEELLRRPQHSIEIEPSYRDLKEVLLTKV